MRSTTVRNWSPTSTNSAAFRMNTSTSQTEKAWSRVAGVISSGERQPSQMPEVTAASTALTPSASAGR